MDFAGQCAFAQRGNDFFLGQLFAAQVFVHQFFVGFSSGFNHVLTPFFRSVHQIGRNIAVFKGNAFVGFVPDDGFHFQQVHHAFKCVFRTHGDNDRYRVGTQAGFHLFHHAEEVRALAVHFVHKCQTGHFVFIGLAPHGFGLGLYAAYRAVHHYRAVQNAHRAFYFNGKVHVSRGVDDVETMFFELFRHTGPVGSYGGGSNGNAAFLFLFHVVGGCRTVMYLTQFVCQTGVEQDTFGRGGFTGVNVSRNTDVAVQADGGFASHLIILSRLETEVRECFVGFCHTVHFFAFFHCAATAFCRVN